jgi:PAS domain S-box-containing protein
MGRRKTGKSDNPARSLRERAEMLLGKQPGNTPTLPTRDVQALIHELNVHQMELELQNEELRQSQVELAHTRDRYADLYEFAPVGYLTLDRDGKVLEANLTAAALLGVEQREFTGANISRYVEREDQDDYYLHRQLALDSEEKQTCEIRMQRGDATQLAVRLESIAFGTGQSRRLRTALIDITEKKRIEEALQRLNEQLEQRVVEQTGEISLLATAISNLGEGVLITSDDLDWPGPLIIFVNEAICRITGYTKQELIGQSPRILQGNDSDRTTLDWMKAQLSAGHSCRVELINYRRDGTPYHAELFITALYDSNGHRTNFVSIHHDVTERKRAEEELRRSHEQLEQRVEERTHALQETKREAERANASKSRFLTAVSHDLRQPLQSLAIYLDVLKRDVEGREQQELALKMSRSQKVMERTLSALLNISLLETGEITPDNRDFTLHDLLEDIAADSRPLAEEKGLELRLIASPCVLHTDRILFQRIIENLVSNSIRYTEHGHVELRCDCEEEGGRIQVSDTGVGMAQDKLDNLFKSSIPTNAHTRDWRNAHGLGLGLVIVKHIADLLGHEITVQSAPGKGTTFTIEVPQGIPLEDLPSLEATMAITGQRRDRGEVLFIDDEPAVLDSFRMLLETEGFNVHTARDGEQALDRLKTGAQPEIVISDYHLPYQTGFEIVERIRADIGKDLPAVIITGDVATPGKKKATSQNCRVLYKPIHGDELIDLIEDLVNGSGAN